jgi:hypothetical protein
VNRRNTTKRPPTHAPLLAVIERLESRAMLAGLGQDSLGGLGSITAVLLPGVSSPPGIVLTGGSPTPGSTAGSGGSQSTGPVLLSGTGSGTGSSTSGSGSSAPNGPVLFSGTGPGTGSSTSGSSSSAPNGPVLFGGTGSGTGSSTGGSGSSTPNGPVLYSGTGSGTGSTTSTTGGSPDPNSPVLLSHYTGGSNAGGQGSGTATGGTLSGSDLWLLYGAGLGAGSSSSGASGGSSSNLLTLLSQYNGGSGVGGQGNGTVGTLTNADLWGMYWSGAGADSSSSSSDEGSLADDPTILAQYTGGSGIGGITPLVYNPQSDGSPVFHSGVFTGDHGSEQFVQTADTGNQGTGEGDASESDDKSRARSWWGIQGWFLGDEPIDDGGAQVVQTAEMKGNLAETLPITRHGESTSTYHTPIMIGHSLWPFPQVFYVPPESEATNTAQTDGSWVSSDEVEPLVLNGKTYVGLDGNPVMRPVLVWVPGRPRDADAWTDNAGQQWKTDQGEISAYGVPPSPPTLSQFAEAGADLLAAFYAGRSLQPRGQSPNLSSRNSNAPGSYRPSSPLPRCPNGGVLPSSPHPHTQLGTEIGRKVGPFTAAREFGSDGQPLRDIHFTDHGRPNVPGHVNPHQHRHIPNPTGGTPQYGPAEPFIP